LFKKSHTLLIIAGPAGWFGLLTGGMLIAGGITGTGLGLMELGLSYTGQLTPEQERQLNDGGAMVMDLSSPGGLVGGSIGLVITGDERGLRSGALYGNLAEGGAQLAYGLGRVGLNELRFQQELQKQFGMRRNLRWDEVRPLLQKIYGYGDPLTRRRFNPLFWNQIERLDLSHSIPQRGARALEQFFNRPLTDYFNRPWNVTPLWSTDHALVDPFRFQFMTRGFKSIYETQQLRGLSGALHLAPPWLVDAGQGAALGLHLRLHRSMTEKP
jgi:hypothetical protein